MALNTEDGRKMLQLVTSRFDDRLWRKKIEKTLSLPAAGVGDESQRTIFLYLKTSLKAYKSRRSDPDSWIVGGYATREVVDRAKFQPSQVGSGVTGEQVGMLGVDPGQEVDEAWWDDMLVSWFEEPESDEETATEGSSAENPVS
jgi:hypothetical protein